MSLNEVQAMKERCRFSSVYIYYIYYYLQKQEPCQYILYCFPKLTLIPFFKFKFNPSL